MKTILILLAGLPIAALAQQGQSGWPVKPIRVVIPFSPGTPIEVPTRAVTRPMTEAFGQQFVFDYRTGASGTIGTELVARAPKDGYTLLATNCSHSGNPAYYKKLPYDTLNDFAPLSQINVTYGNLLVIHPSLPARSVKDFIALAKARPGEIKYASAGIGSPPHVSAALFAAMAGVKLLHVLYKGTAVAFNDLLGGHGGHFLVSPHGHAGRVVGGNHVVELQQRMIDGRRLHRPHVESGSAQMALLQRLAKGLLVVDAAPGRRDEHGARLHGGDRRVVYQPAGGFGERRMYGHHVGLAQ